MAYTITPLTPHTGAEVRGILEFPTVFPRSDRSPAEVVALRTTRRFGPRLLLAAFCRWRWIRGPQNDRA